MSLVSGKRVHIHRPISFLARSQERYERGLFFRQGALPIICPNFFPSTGPQQQLKDVPLDEDFFHFAHGWTRLIRISWTLWFELLRIRRWTHISPWYVLDAPPGTPASVFLFLEMLSQSISFFYSMPTKSFTMPYHLNKGKQKHRKLNQLFPGQRRPRKSRFNYKPRLLMERRASGYRESPAWRKTALPPRFSPSI